MCPTTRKGLSLFLLTLNIVVIFQALPTQCCGTFSTKYTIVLRNGLKSRDGGNKPNLKIHCASKDIELGYHELVFGATFSWDTCISNIWGNTMFFCHFWWGFRDAALEVFNSKTTKDCRDNVCNWFIDECSIGINGNGWYQWSPPTNRFTCHQIGTNSPEEDRPEVQPPMALG